MIKIGDKVLITTTNWFMAPNGSEYKAVWGTVNGVWNDEATLGIKTNRGSTNWYVNVGNITIAGCQIHYAIKSDTVHLEEVLDYGTTDGVLTTFTRPSKIYNADGAI